jgi:hypothetical protein
MARLTLTAFGLVIVELILFEPATDESTPDRAGIGFTSELDPER